ncbi:hypothetical protein ACFL2Y_05020, partial [Candidatus Omnitrophota bacterium]
NSLGLKYFYLLQPFFCVCNDGNKQNTSQWLRVKLCPDIYALVLEQGYPYLPHRDRSSHELKS